MRRVLRQLTDTLGHAVPAVCAGLIVAVLAGGCESEPVITQAKRGPIEPGSFRATWDLTINTSAFGNLDRMFLRDDVLFVYTDDNVVQAISSEAGVTQFVAADIVGPRERLWPPVVIRANDRLGTAVDRAIVFPSGTRYFVYSDGGELINVAQVEEAMTSPSISSGGDVFSGLAGINNGLFVRVDPTKKFVATINRVLLRGSVQSQAAIYQNTAYVADTTGRVWGIALRPGSGALTAAWQEKYFRTNNAVNAPIRVDGTGVYVASTDSQLYCLDRNTGRLKWSYFGQVSLYRPPYLTDKFVLQPVESLGVVCLSKTEGATNGREPVWIARDARDVLSQDSKNVYMLMNDGTLAAFDKTTGEELFRSERSDFTRYARNLTGPRIFAGMEDGTIVAIDPVLSRGEIGVQVRGNFKAGPIADAR